MMTTGQIPERRAVEGAALAMGMTMMMAAVRRTSRVVRKGSGKGWEYWMGRRIGRQLRTGRGKGS